MSLDTRVSLSPRDPVRNTYLFIDNNAVGEIDLLGLLTNPGWRDWQKCTPPRVWDTKPDGTVPAADGCSFPSGLGFMLPKGGTKDDPTGKCPFLSACNFHDLCYSDCQKPKAKCDDGFRALMYHACSGCAAKITDKKKNKAFLDDCYKWADRYAWGVDGSIGEDAYKNRQQQNCDCVCKQCADPSKCTHPKP